MAYVPPALRKKQQEAAAANDASEVNDNPPSPPSNLSQSEGLPRAEDIHEHYWPLDPAAGKALLFNPHPSTLNSSASSPNKLAYIMLFKDANPRWHTNRIIYAKTNLHLLPGSDESATSTETHSKTDAKAPEDLSEQQQEEEEGQQHPDPIPVFEQTAATLPGFRFAGHHRIARLQFLAPHSADLVRMLEQKFSTTDRQGHVHQKQRKTERWRESLELRWAVVQFERDEGAEGAPDVRIDGERGVGREKAAPGKSVNEMLREMRVGGEGETGAGSGPV